MLEILALQKLLQWFFYLYQLIAHNKPFISIVCQCSTRSFLEFHNLLIFWIHWLTQDLKLIPLTFIIHLFLVNPENFVEHPNNVSNK